MLAAKAGRDEGHHHLHHHLSLNSTSIFQLNIFIVFIRVKIFPKTFFLKKKIRVYSLHFPVLCHSHSSDAWLKSCWDLKPSPLRCTRSEALFKVGCQTEVPGCRPK